jgi:hypothetical protein
MVLVLIDLHGNKLVEDVPLMELLLLVAAVVLVEVRMVIMVEPAVEVMRVMRLLKELAVEMLIPDLGQVLIHPLMVGVEMVEMV